VRIQSKRMYDTAGKVNLKSRHIKKSLQVVCIMHFICKQNNVIEELRAKQFVLLAYLFSILCGSQEVTCKLLPGKQSSPGQL